MSGSSSDSTFNITAAHIARHTPQRAKALGREAALIDIAQDLMLRHLSECGLMSELVFKGGTALRKLYAGVAGRFSTDLDFCVREIGTSAADVLSLLADEIDGLAIGPFVYGVEVRRGKHHLLFASPQLGAPEKLTSKVDVSPPPWLEPTSRNWVPMTIHRQYGAPLPVLPVIRLEENLAEKIARLNRVTPARDMYDLRWIADNLLRTEIDIALVRRLAVLKVWVDTNGVTAGAGAGSGGSTWLPAHSGGPFDPVAWLRIRSEDEYDEEDIGAIAVPAPLLAEMSADVSRAYGFLADLDDNEKIVAQAREKDRQVVLRMLAELPEARLAHAALH